MNIMLSSDSTSFTPRGHRCTTAMVCVICPGGGILSFHQTNVFPPLWLELFHLSQCQPHHVLYYCSLGCPTTDWIHSCCMPSAGHGCLCIFLTGSCLPSCDNDCVPLECSEFDSTYSECDELSVLGALETVAAEVDGIAPAFGWSIIVALSALEASRWLAACRARTTNFSCIWLEIFAISSAQPIFLRSCLVFWNTHLTLWHSTHRHSPSFPHLSCRGESRSSYW